MLRVRTVVIAGLLAIALALIVTLSGSPVTVASTNTVGPLGGMGALPTNVPACLKNEALPQGTSAIRLRMFMFTGAKITVTVLSHGRIFATGEREAGWTGGGVTIPIKPLAQGVTGAQVCFKLFQKTAEVSALSGGLSRRPPPGHHGAKPKAARAAIEYLQPARSSWWSMVGGVARRMGLGRSFTGSWIAILTILLMGLVVILASRIAVQELQ